MRANPVVSRREWCHCHNHCHCHARRRRRQVLVQAAPIPNLDCAYTYSTARLATHLTCLYLYLFSRGASWLAEHSARTYSSLFSSSPSSSTFTSTSQLRSFWSIGRDSRLLTVWSVLRLGSFTRFRFEASPTDLKPCMRIRESPTIGLASFDTAAFLSRPSPHFRDIHSRLTIL